MAFDPAKLYGIAAKHGAARYGRVGSVVGHRPMRPGAARGFRVGAKSFGTYGEAMGAARSMANRGNLFERGLNAYKGLSRGKKLGLAGLGLGVGYMAMHRSTNRSSGAMGLSPRSSGGASGLYNY